MNTKDEHIQKQIEEGSSLHSIDADAYRTVFRSLKKNPDYKLPSGFAERVASMAQVPTKAFNWDKFFLIGGCVSFLFALLYAFISTKASFSTGIFTFVSSYSGLAIFAVAFIALLNWADKKLVNKSTAV